MVSGQSRRGGRQPRLLIISAPVIVRLIMLAGDNGMRRRLLLHAAVDMSLGTNMTRARGGGGLGNGISCCCGHSITP